MRSSAKWHSGISCSALHSLNARLGSPVEMSLTSDVVRHGLCSWWRDWLCLECGARQRQAWKRQLATNLMLISWLCRDLAEDSWGMSRISNPTTGFVVRRVGLVLWAECVTEGSLMPKNCLVNVASPCLVGLDAVVLLWGCRHCLG